MILPPCPAMWVQLCRAGVSFASHGLMAAVLTVSRSLLWEGHSQLVALEGHQFLSGSCAIDFTLKIILRGICVRGKQQGGRVGGWTQSREGALYLRRRCRWDSLCKRSSAEVHLLAGYGQRLHNACQHTLPGSSTSEGCQPPESRCRGAVPVSSI